MQKIAHPKFSIIIPTFNGEEFIDPCLASILNTKRTDYEVLAFDDKSTDNSFHLLEKYAKKGGLVSVFINEHNLGAAATRNRAVSQAKGDILVFLDIDTEVDPGWLDAIDKAFTNNSEIAAVQCTVLDMHRRNLVQHSGGKLMKETAWLVPDGQWRPYRSNEPAKPIMAVSCALAVKKTSFKKINGFDELEGVHSEDVDLSWRLWISGEQIYSCPQAIVYHWQKNMSQRANMQATLTSIYYHLAKNSLRSIIKNYSTINMVTYLPLNVAILISRSLVFIVTRGNTAAFFGFGKAINWNMRNLRNSLALRKEITRTRKYSDNYLFQKVFLKENMFSVIRKYFI